MWGHCGAKMSREKKATSYPGVRFREHASRKHGVRLDRYFFIRYRMNNQLKEEGVGWASEGMTAEKASKLLGEIRENIRLGSGPKSLTEMREQDEQAKTREQERIELAQRQAVLYGKFFEEEYFPTTSLKKKKGSIESEKALHTKWISPVLGNVPLLEISYSHIEKIINTMREADRKPRTIKYALSVISQVWTYAKDKGIANGDSPTRKFKISRLDNERARFLTRQEARLLLDELAKHSLDLRDMATLSLFCGLRAGEIFKLQWADINMEAGTIFLRGTKAGNSRYAFFTDEVRHILIERGKRSFARDQYLFPATNGNKRERVSKTFRKIVQELGLNDGIDDPKQKVVFHTLRHTFASWLAQGQIPLYNIQRLMGHSEARMVQRYAHLSNESMREAVNVLSGVLTPKEAKEEQAMVIPFKEKTN